MTYPPIAEAVKGILVSSRLVHKGKKESGNFEDCSLSSTAKPLWDPKRFIILFHFLCLEEVAHTLRGGTGVANSDRIEVLA